jgi:hypothetical protein
MKITKAWRIELRQARFASIQPGPSGPAAFLCGRAGYEQGEELEHFDSVVHAILQVGIRDSRRCIKR